MIKYGKYVLIFLGGMLCTIIILLNFIGPGRDDWSYKLPNEYEVSKINSNEIIVECVSVITNNNVKIPSFVKEFSYNDRFVCTRNILSINENNIFNEAYYILDTKEKVLYGPYDSIIEFKNKLDEFEIVVEKWYRTSPDPNMYNKLDSKEVIND